MEQDNGQVEPLLLYQILEESSQTSSGKTEDNIKFTTEDLRSHSFTESDFKNHKTEELLDSNQHQLYRSQSLLLRSNRVVDEKIPEDFPNNRLMYDIENP